MLLKPANRFQPSPTIDRTAPWLDFSIDRGAADALRRNSLLSDA
jgi:hypothetical protein